MRKNITLITSLRTSVFRWIMLMFVIVFAACCMAFVLSGTVTHSSASLINDNKKQISKLQNYKLNSSGLQENFELFKSKYVHQISDTLVPGDLDLTFGSGGKVVTGFFANSVDVAYQSVVQNDGRIVTAGRTLNNQIALARYNINGNLDTTFGSNGKVTTNIVGGFTANALGVQNDGKIIVAGSSRPNGNSDFTLVRYNANGSIDTTFDEDGIVSTSITVNTDIAYDLAIQTDGKIVAVGSSLVSGVNSNFAVVRYNNNGSLDSSFDGDGIVITQVSIREDEARSIAIQTDGKIVVGGWRYVDATGYDFALTRYNTNGILDNNFDGDGIVITHFEAASWEYIEAIILQTDGKIVAAGHGAFGINIDQDFAMARYNANGSLDTSFNSSGKVKTRLGTGEDLLLDIIQQLDGKLIVAGWSNVNAGSSFGDTGMVLRYLPNGLLDSSFNGTGIVRTEFGSPKNEFYDVVLQNDGKIIATGNTGISGSDIDFAIARYQNASPTINVTPSSGQQNSTTFVTNGNSLTPNGSVKLLMIDSSSAQQEIGLATANNSGQTTVYFSPNCSVIPGNYSLQLKDAATNGLSNLVPISINPSPGCYLAQTVNLIEPNIVTFNTRTKLVVKGTNFGQPFSAKVITPENPSGVDIGQGDLQYVSPTEVHVWVNMGGTSAYNATLNIYNIRSSTQRTFRVIPSTPPPVIDPITSPVIANQVATLTVDGNNFQSDFRAFIITQNGTFELLSGNKNRINPTQIKLNVVMRGSPPYNATVKIQNPDGQFAEKIFQVVVQNQPPPKPLQVLAIEVTQAVQDLQNNVPLIQGKDTYVRVHVKNTSLLTGDIPNVKGKLIATRIEGNNRISLGERESIEKTVKRNPNRATLNDSYLFTLPTHWTRGNVELQFEGINHDFDYREPDDNSDGKVNVIFQNAPTLKIKLVRVGWQNPNGNSSNSDIEEIKQYLKKQLPTHNIIFSDGVISSQEQPRPDTDYLILLNRYLTNKRNTECGSEGNCKEYYLGVISLSVQAAPNCTTPSCISAAGLATPILRGCSDLYGNVASGFHLSAFNALNAKARYNHLHEIGHLLGRHHTFDEMCLNNPSDGTIGERGTNQFSANAVFGFDGNKSYPTNTPDVMNYGMYPWGFSKDNYSKIFNHIRNRFGSTSKVSDKSEFLVQQGENTILVSGSIFNEQNGELATFYRLPAPTNIISSGTGTLQIKIFDINNQEIVSYPFEPEFSIEGGIRNFSLLLPYNQNANHITLVKNGQILASKQASANPPLVTVTYPNGGEVLNGSTANLQWTASDADSDQLRYLVQYSSNAGATWETIASDLNATSYQLSLDSVSGTSQGLIRVIASDGFHSNRDQSDNYFGINSHAPQATISNPQNNNYFVGDQNIVLSGSAFDLEDGQLNDESLLWNSDIEGSLGSGQSLSVNAATLQEGIHVITLTARDNSAQTGTATVILRVYRTQPPIPTTLSVAPNNLNFVAQQGTSNLSQPQILAVRNEGDGTLNWSASSNQSWLQLAQTTGTAPSNVEVRINPSGQPLGNHTATVTITTPDSPNSPQTINVSLNIVAYSISSQTPFDFDGDNKTDISIFRPSNGQWWINSSSTGQTFAAQFGSESDKVTPGDFTGDGKTDIAFWRPSTGQWFILRSESASFYAFPFGADGDIPIPADYDGDGKTDAAVFRPSNAAWYILRSGDGGVTIQQFGASGDKPVAADYDGDRKADISIIRYGASGMEWWYQRSSSGQITALQFGESSDKAVPGDYTGDGKADIAFWRPSNGFWYILRSENTSFYAFPFGSAGDIPSPGDYDGDGKFDAAVFRASNSGWYLMRSTVGVTSVTYGIPGDVPIPSVFIP